MQPAAAVRTIAAAANLPNRAVEGFFSILKMGFIVDNSSRTAGLARGLRRRCSSFLMFPTRRVTAFLLGASLASLPLTASGAQIELERRVSEVYRTASPAVVNITAQIQSYDWFRGQVTQEGSGSGFVYDSGGRIVTNYHVVEAADQLQVTFKGGEVRDARLVGADPANDLAVLQVAAGAGDPRPLALGDSDALEVGRFVVAIGHPFGLDQTLTTGVVSGLGRVIESPDQGFIGEIIQTDAAINQGQLGGTAPRSRRPGGGREQRHREPHRDLGRHRLRDPRHHAGARRAGTHRERPVSPSPSGHLGAGDPRAVRRLLPAGRNRRPPEGGLMIRAVARGGPADRAGLRGAGRVGRIGNLRVRYGGDYLLAVDGRTVRTERDLLLLLETNYRVGDEVGLRIWRDERELDVRVRLIDRDTVIRRRRR